MKKRYDRPSVLSSESTETGQVPPAAAIAAAEVLGKGLASAAVSHLIELGLSSLSRGLDPHVASPASVVSSHLKAIVPVVRLKASRISYPSTRARVRFTAQYPEANTPRIRQSSLYDKMPTYSGASFRSARDAASLLIGAAIDDRALLRTFEALGLRNLADPKDKSRSRRGS